VLILALQNPRFRTNLLIQTLELFRTVNQSHRTTFGHGTADTRAPTEGRGSGGRQYEAPAREFRALRIGSHVTRMKQQRREIRTPQISGVACSTCVSRPLS